MQVNQLKAGTILSYLQTGLSVLLGLLYTPVMIRLLGKNEYGLYNTVVSTISMLSILSLGFNSGYIKFYSTYRKNGDWESINRLNGLFLLIFAVIGLIALLCGLYLMRHLDLVFIDGLTTEEYGTARTLMLLLTLNLAVSFPMSVFQNIISAHERFVFLKILVILRTVMGPLLTLPLLLMGYRSVAMVLVTVAVSFAVDICYYIYVVYKLKEKFWFSHFEKGLIKSLFGFTAFVAINMVIDQINWNIDKVLLGRFRGTAMVAVYAVGYNLYNYYMTISLGVSGVFTPRIHRICNDFGHDQAALTSQLTELFIKIGRIQFLVLGLIATGVIFFGRSFIYFWVGTGYEESYPVALLLILPASIALIQNAGIEIQRAENKHRFRSIVYAGMALINLGLSIWLCQRYGAVGSAFGTAVSLILANGLIMNIYYHRHCNIDILKFWKNILRMCLGLLIPCVLGFAASRFLVFENFFYLVLGVLLYTAVYCVSVWMLSMNTYEKDLLRKLFRRILPRVH